MAEMILKNINKIYPNGVQAVFDFNLEIKEGEFIVLVGPSGCGKSTTLRMIAGLEDISSGELRLGDRLLNDAAPKERDIAMVFQNYALYAHMTVYHNMAFSLTLRKVDSDIIHERVMQAAEILGLTPYLNRRPAHLSGGQRQRVAVGRAIIRDPKVFLFDEPLSNLDAKLRESMRKELKLLHNRLKTTMVYVTHDQIEALTLADRIVIMKDGYIQQIGTPIEVYSNPANLFVANFIGLPAMNVLSGKIDEKGQLQLGEHFFDISKHEVYSNLKELGYFGKEITVGVRPENINISKKNTSMTQVVLSELLGSNILVHFAIGDRKVIAKVDARDGIKTKDLIDFGFDQSHLYFFDKETEKRIYAK